MELTENNETALAFNTADGTRTSSLIIAEGTDNEHASVIKLVRRYVEDLEEFGRIGFEIQKGQPLPQGGFAKSTEIALLNEQQATLLMTYMRNSEIVRKFKINLVKAFFVLATGSELSLSNYEYKKDRARAQKLEVESRLISASRNIVSKTFPKSQRIQDQAFSALCRKVVGYCPFEFIGVSMDHNSDEPQSKFVERFINECCVIDTDTCIEKKVLFEAFSIFQKGICKPQEEYHYNYFCKLINQYSFKETRSGSGPRMWKGIDLKDDSVIVEKHHGIKGLKETV